MTDTLDNQEMLDLFVKQYIDGAHGCSMEFDDAQALAVAIKEQTAEIERLREALTPSGETKADYMSEFNFPVSYITEEGEDLPWNAVVPWVTIKEIMAFILSRADRNREGKV